MIKYPSQRLDEDAGEHAPLIGGSLRSNLAETYMFQEEGGEGASSGKTSEIARSGFSKLDAITDNLADELRDTLDSDGSGIASSSGKLVGDRNPAAGGDPVELTDIVGTNGDDVLVATAAGVPEGWTRQVFAFDGDDLILRDRTGGYDPAGGLGNVTIDGGDDFDTVSYAAAVNGVTVDMNFGWAQMQSNGAPFGLDYLNNIEGVIGTFHDDSMVGNGDANTFWGLSGDDNISGNGGDDTIYGHDGNDTLNGGSGDDTVDGGDGDDDISGGSNNDLIYAGDGNDDVSAGNGHDIVHDGEGNDDVHGGGGNDLLHVNAGNDTVSGGLGNDSFFVSGFGDNIISGNGGNDTIFFGNSSVDVHLAFGYANRTDGTDQVSGVENVVTGMGWDNVVGTGYDNIIATGDGNDILLGLAGDDFLATGTGNDEAWGHADDDTILGQAGNDELHGNEGDDTLSGGEDDDTLTGGAGDDEMSGGTGADVFVYNMYEQGYDLITDFILGEDTFSFGEGFFAGGPGPIVLSDVLGAWNVGGTDSILVANTAESGWEALAYLEGVNATELSQRIDNGTILNTGTGLEGPGGFQGHQFEPAFDMSHDFIV